MKKKIVLLLLGALCLSAVEWKFAEDSTDSNVTYMSNRSIAVEDDSKTAHIIFKDYDNKLYHLKYDGSSWSKESISDDGNYSSIVIDANNLHVSYLDQSQNNIIYQKYDGSWSTQNADSADGNYTKITLINGNPYIVYSKNGKIGVVFYDSSISGWTNKESSDISGAKDLDIAKDSNNNIHVVYYNACAFLLQNVRDSSQDIGEQLVNNSDHAERRQLQPAVF